MSKETQGFAAKPTWMPKAIGVVVVLIIGAVVAMTQGKKEPEPVAVANDGKTANAVAETKPESAVVPSTSTVALAEASKTTKPGATSKPAASPYKDGIYSTTGNYTAPSGSESIDVTLTLKDGIIEAASVKANAENPISKKFQDGFVASYKTLVVGKNIADLSLSKVSGASLTTNGFNEALGELKTQASV